MQSAEQKALVRKQTLNDIDSFDQRHSMKSEDSDSPLSEMFHKQEMP